jgi:hypothetical protein
MFLAVVKHRYLQFLTLLHAFWTSDLALFFSGICNLITTSGLKLLDSVTDRHMHCSSYCIRLALKPPKDSWNCQGQLANAKGSCEHVYIKGTCPPFFPSFLFSLVSSNSAIYEADYSCISYVPSHIAIELKLVLAFIIIIFKNLLCLLSKSLEIY